MAIGSLITMDEASEILKVSPVRVGQFVKDKRLPVARRIGRNYLFDRDAVKKFAKQPRPNGRPRRAG